MAADRPALVAHRVTKSDEETAKRTARNREKDPEWKRNIKKENSRAVSILSIDHSRTVIRSGIQEENGKVIGSSLAVRVVQPRNRRRDSSAGTPTRQSTLTSRRISQ
ncbi:hypothetical protein EVAR_64310_1 [Eumeta japonica]|uniref:Uncharacterized protein n=1 Tax=Eumeta variegata TaxID=151549 RepID=A0A4C2ACA5_EUMVA|nr:hypothetical protein EVAR_64310_1 [Eumeta japonica]